jgi:hypothetical protein
MRIRTQLILAAFVLAVIPLAAIVTYSYHSSRRALESTYRREADRLTRQMDRRLAGIRAELGQRMDFVSALAQDNTAAEVGNIVTALGDAGMFVDALEYKPLDPQPPNVDLEVEVPDIDVEVAEAPEQAPEAPAAPMPVPPHAPMVIELPPMPEFPQYVMSEEQKELLQEIGRIGGELGEPDLTVEDRKDLLAEMTAAQR